jgi:hypothetical protein
MGPGVTPIVAAEVAGLSAANRASTGVATDVWDAVMRGDAKCAPER